MRICDENTLLHARRLYRTALVDSRQASTGGHTSGCWDPDPSVESRQLLTAVTQAENDPRSRLIKHDSRIRTMRASLLNHDTFIKRYDLQGILEKIKYVARPSRARRFWAAARTFRQLGLAAARPLGFLEMRSGTVASRSYIITAFIQAINLYEWIRKYYASLPDDGRRQTRAALADFLLATYRMGVYHRDTKMTNILVPDEARSLETRDFIWTDLECVACGFRPHRRDVIRNVVQLNGSATEILPPAERQAFLNELSATFPWITRPHAVNTIQRWTERRLTREKILGCGP